MEGAGGILAGAELVFRWTQSNRLPTIRRVHLKTTTEENPTVHSAGTISRNDLVQLLNEDLSREYQAIISYVVYSRNIVWS